MESPTFYLVADGNAYALDEDGTAFGAAVFQDGTIDWENSYDFSDHLEAVSYTHLTLPTICSV